MKLHKVVFVFFMSCVLAFNLVSGQDFLTDKEYGRQLYLDPRGVACIKCHGVDGKGSFIAKYKTRSGKVKEIIAPDITNLDYEHFKEGIINGKGVMPRYYLTDEEINAIYTYINEGQEDVR
ncbi:cytochrome c [Helicobacter sp. 11S02629-2]|uniref:c-type cytochrome n=1 Tax=Helicobacter sp. 11S02629-2 TaxID=1476195 RepID=UPI000BA782A1|nr:cytochrome c [Helicobacter sp. 11S02629-2]PAF45341.1 hypothetical protein BKH40_03890 [Helicobacter sp. 11S02629-2]